MEIQSVTSLSEYVMSISESELPHSAFSSPAFLETWWERFGSCYEFFGLLGYTGNRLVAAMPLYRASSRIRSPWRVVGDTFYNVVSIPAIGSNLEPFLYSVVSYLGSDSRRGDLIICDVPDNSELFEILNRLGRLDYLYECPFVDIGGKAPDVYAKVLSNKRRAEVRRGRRRLDRVGSVSHLIIDGHDAAMLAEILPYCIQLHGERFSETTNTSGFSEPRYRSFYETLLSRMVSRDEALLSVVLLDDIPISFVLGFINEKTFIDAIPAFDPAFAKFGLGHVNIALLLEELSERGFEVFDFSKGNSVYKQKWATGSVNQYSAMIQVGSVPTVALIVNNMLTRLKTFGRKKHINSRVKRALAWFRTIHTSNPYEVQITRDDSVGASHNSTEWRTVSSYGQVRDWPCEIRREVMDDLYTIDEWAEFSESEEMVHVKLARGVKYSFPKSSRARVFAD